MTADDNHYPGPHFGSVVAFFVSAAFAYLTVSIILYLATYLTAS